MGTVLCNPYQCEEVLRRIQSSVIKNENADYPVSHLSCRLVSSRLVLSDIVLDIVHCDASRLVFAS